MLLEIEKDKKVILNIISEKSEKLRLALNMQAHINNMDPAHVSGLNHYHDMADTAKEELDVLQARLN